MYVRAQQLAVISFERDSTEIHDQRHIVRERTQNFERNEPAASRRKGKKGLRDLKAP